jgi:hypothetical protein
MTEPTVSVPVSVLERVRQTMEDVAEAYVYQQTGDYLLEAIAALDAAMNDPDQARSGEEPTP